MANWIEALLGKDIADNGSIVSPRRGVLNFLSGFGITVSAADNPTTGYTDVTIATTGSSTGGVDYKDSCRVATTADITLSGLQTIDGVALSANERVFVWKQSAQSENGIYAAAAGAWTRTTDADTDELVTTGMMVPVSEGTLYGGKTFKLITADPIVLDTTGLEFELQPQTLSEILAKGNTSGANNILVDDSQYIQIGTTTPAGSGALRLRGNGDGDIRWRNVGDTGDYGIGATAGDSILIGGGSAQPFSTYVNASSSGSVFIQNNVDTIVGFDQAFFGNPTMQFNSEFAGGTATLAVISTTVPVASMNGIDVLLVGGNAGPGNNNAGNTKILPGVPTGAGAAAAVQLCDASLTMIAQATATTFEVSTNAWLNIVKAAALGGGAAATLGTIGGSGPTAAGQNTWIEMQSNGTTVWVPCWI